jgi:hypothetical protein
LRESIAERIGVREGRTVTILWKGRQLRDAFVIGKLPFNDEEVVVDVRGKTNFPIEVNHVSMRMIRNNRQGLAPADI